LQFIFSIIGSTIPVPSGSFIPVFKIGASLGRMIGEAMHLWFPQGVHYGSAVAPIIPGKSSTTHRPVVKAVGITGLQSELWNTSGIPDSIHAII
jgi:H+/Cl- antiporter ClcA